MGGSGPTGRMQTTYRNRNRGYQRLRVWEDAVAFYAGVCRVFRAWPYELRRVAANQIAAADSIHRNIAEGYCRRSINEYIQHLYVALASLGECVSGLGAYRHADQVEPEEHDALDAAAFKLENGLSRLIESLEAKRDKGDWIDRMVVRESNAAYETAGARSATRGESSGRRPTVPLSHRSTTPTIHHSAPEARTA